MVTTGLASCGTELIRCPRLLRSFLLKIPADSLNSDFTPDRCLPRIVGGQGLSTLGRALTRHSPRPMGRATLLNTLLFGPDVSLLREEGPCRHVAWAGVCAHVGCRCAAQDPRARMTLPCGRGYKQSVNPSSEAQWPRPAALTERGATLALSSRTGIANACG